jgi:hypothetical protein
VFLGQNANKTIKMHYHWGNLDFTLGKNHEILRGFEKKLQYGNVLSLGKSWVYEMGKKPRDSAWFWVKMQTKL